MDAKTKKTHQNNELKKRRINNLLDNIAEGLWRVCFSVFKTLLIDVLIDIVIYGYGYLMLKVFTLGRYPKLYGAERSYCIAAGLVAVVTTLCLIVYLQQAS